jgi:hypothetical protein
MPEVVAVDSLCLAASAPLLSGSGWTACLFRREAKDRSSCCACCACCVSQSPAREGGREQVSPNLRLPPFLHGVSAASTRLCNHITRRTSACRVTGSSRMYSRIDAESAGARAAGKACLPPAPTRKQRQSPAQMRREQALAQAQRPLLEQLHLEQALVQSPWPALMQQERAQAPACLRAALLRLEPALARPPGAQRQRPGPLPEQAPASSPEKGQAQVRALQRAP